MILETNKIHHGDCLELMSGIPDGSIDVILTDPPYKYLKRQKLEVDFDEPKFFAHVKRVLKKDGFIVLFGRGTSFYRWNTMLADMGFQFKEEIVWDKSHGTSPLMAINRIHETVSIYSKGKGVIQRSKVPYLEMKSFDLASVVQDISRLKSILNNTKSLDAVMAYLEDNMSKVGQTERIHKHSASVQPSDIMNQDRSAAVVKIIREGMNEKTIIRSDYQQNEKFTKHGVSNAALNGDRCVNVVNGVVQGMNEKSIIKTIRDHYTSIHPTQKPVRLLERLLALVSQPGDLVLDPFSGSGSTFEACMNTGRNCIGIELDQEYYGLSVERNQKLVTRSSFSA